MTISKMYGTAVNNINIHNYSFRLIDNIPKLRPSPGLDNFYEKIGVKTFGLLYPTVSRLQAPK